LISGDFGWNIVPQTVKVIRRFFGKSDSGGRCVRLRFGECVLDTEARELRRGGAPHELSPKGFQFLELLLACRPRAVPKSDIHERLWPDTFVSDSSLARLASEVRAAIGDDARHPRLLRTVHRHGYAFSGTAAVAAAEAVPLPAPCRLVWGERQIPLLEGENVLGRGSEAAVRIDLGRVSRLHARIVVEGERALLEDLGSKNGTFHRGRRLEAPVELTDGDEIGVGTVVLLFRAAHGDSTTETGTVR
jgi:DNA-binding winged helix-turn-helix (wHTH) protein